ncbi:3-deoxy-D-manno-octulosonic acid transferase [bacterium]|nr:3-deoxy-D-manno-octulosonic acid transferase [bacterium]
MIYGILSTLLFILILPFWLLAGLFKRKLIFGIKEKMALYKDLPKLNKPVVFYGVSVGEVLAMENLIKKTRETFPSLDIVVMTGTKTGQDIARKKLSETANYITYFPLDFPIFINRMLNKINPSKIFIMETELWPNFANITNRKNFPAYIINARISDRTFNSYKKLKFIFEPILKKYTAIFPQSEQDFNKFINLGANSQTTKVMGNLKFDIKKPDKIDFEHNYPTIIAGSTHTGEDEIVIKTFCKLKKEIPNLKLIIAPRHPERNESVYKLVQATGFGVCKRSENGNFDSSEIMLLDTMGELGKMYSVCDIAFLGGSFNKTGGHNPLEATIFSKPVISGPCIHNFKDIYAILTHEKAAKVVKNQEEFYMECKNLLLNQSNYDVAVQACHNVFEKNNGALQFVLEVIK